MVVEVNFEIDGLYPEEREHILKRLNLIKDKMYNRLDIDYSVLKSKPNWITAYCYFDDVELALGLFRLLDAIKVPNIRTDYDDYIPLCERAVPSMSLDIVKNIEFEDYNTDKGLVDDE